MIRLKLQLRQHDVTIGSDDDPYLLRWHVIPRNRIFNIYLHKFMRSDDDRALHDHPWPSLGIIIKGEYLEHMPEDPDGYRAGNNRNEIVVHRKAGRPVLRGPRHIHRIQIIGASSGPVWTIFITGPKVREWGFWCPQGFRHWSKFVSLRPGGNDIGPGCGK